MSEESVSTTESTGTNVDSGSKTENKSPVKVQQDTQLTDEQCEEMRKQVISKRSFDFISDAEFPHFASYLFRFKNECMNKEDYLEAKQVSAMLEACKAEHQTRNLKNQNSLSLNQNLSSQAEQKRIVYVFICECGLLAHSLFV